MSLLTLDQFLQKIPRDKPQDYDGAFWGECIDLIKFYLDWCFWMKPGRIGNANELWIDKFNVLSDLFYQIEWISDLQRWDIIFLNTWISFQHVWIYTSDMWDKVQIFDQVWNGDKVGWERAPAYRMYKKSIVLGVWRLKDEVTTRINEFCDRMWIKKRGNDEYFSCREILSILSKM